MKVRRTQEGDEQQTGLQSCQEEQSPDLRVKSLLEELMMTSLASLVMSPDDTSRVSWPICIRYTPREGDDTWPKDADTHTELMLVFKTELNKLWEHEGLSLQGFFQQNIHWLAHSAGVKMNKSQSIILCSVGLDWSLVWDGWSRSSKHWWKSYRLFHLFWVMSFFCS